MVGKVFDPRETHQSKEQADNRRICARQPLAQENIITARVSRAGPMMRRTKTRGVAGACCCLVPVIILVVFAVIVVIMTAVVWNSAVPNAFRWESGPHSSNAYRDGFQEGNRLGAAYATRGDAEPSGRALDALAEREANQLHVTRYRRQWIQGFRSGFARGFTEFSKQALRSPARCLNRSVWSEKIRVVSRELAQIEQRRG